VLRRALAVVAQLGVVGRQKSESLSGSSFVDVVQAVEDRPNDHIPGDRPLARDRGLQLQGSVGAILIVVAGVLGQHRPDMSLAQRHDVIQALAA
jgi:hypothetical protein